jgi:V8-like Glu-specific endopeptidase
MKITSLISCFVLLFALPAAFSQSMVVGEHLYDQVLESPHPYAASKTGEPEIVWTDYYEFPGAAYLVFEFAQFDLAPGDWVEVRHPYGEQVHVYTGKGFLDQGGDFITKTVLGSEAVIELYSTNTSHNHYGYRIERVSRGFSDEELSRMYGDRAICGSDDKLDAKCFETSHPDVYEVSRAVARLMMDGIGTCTAWLVSCDNHVMTNSHCSRDGDLDSQAKLNRIEFQFMYERPQCGGGTATFEYSFMGGTFLENEYYIDYALVQAPASEDPASVYGWITLDDRLADVGEMMFIAGHPGARPKEIALYSTHSTDPTGECQVNTVNAAPCRGGSAPEVGYYCDTEGGSSGSPVLSRETMRAIALHHCGSCPNRGSRIQNVINLIQSGPNPLPPCSFFSEEGTVEFDRPFYGCDDIISITVVDASLIGAGSQDVEIWSDTQNIPEVVWLTEDTPDLGSFTGTIPTTTDPPVPGNGQLSVAEGDTITVLYIDEDDGQGGTNIQRYGYAEADCTPPIISNVAVTNISGQSFTVTWNTNEPANSTLYWGSLIPPTNTVTIDGDTINHQVLVTDLNPGTEYYLMVESTDFAGNVAQDNSNGSYYRVTTLYILWDQPVSASSPSRRANQVFPNSQYSGYTCYLADDFLNTDTWLIKHVFVPGELYNGGTSLANATTLHWRIYADNGGLPAGYPGGGAAPFWSLDLSTNDPQITLLNGLQNNLSDTGITLENPLQLPAGTWWLMFYPTMNFSSHGQFGRISSDTANLEIGKFINPGGEFGYGTNWMNWDNVSSVTHHDLAFRLSGSVPGQATPTPQPTPTSHPNECLNHGDINFDSSITAADAQLAFLIALGTYAPTYEEECAADCNGDGMVTAADAQLIFLTALGSETCADPL